MALSIRDRVDKAAFDRFEKMSQKISKSTSKDSLEPVDGTTIVNNRLKKETSTRERRENRMLTNIQE